LEKRMARLYGPDGKLLGRRKSEKSRQAMVKQALISKLYEDRFIVKEEDGSFTVDISGRIQEKYGSEEATVADIKTILNKIAVGLEAQGERVKINRIISSRRGDSDERGSVADRSGGEGRDNGGGV
jgi:hypothetical protein